MKTTLYTRYVNFYKQNFTGLSTYFLCLLAFSFLLTCIQTGLYAQKTTSTTSKKNTTKSEQQRKAQQTLRQSTNSIWFEKNEGQFPSNDIQYGFRTSFGIIGVFDSKLRMVIRQSNKQQTTGHQVVDINFPGANKNWTIEPGSRSQVKGTYNTANGIIAPSIFNEIILKEVYPGISLKLYSSSDGSLEFDWILNRASDFNNIRMKFEGQDGLQTDKKGSLLIKLHHDNIRIKIPETYQVINGIKKVLPAKMQLAENKSTICYTVSGNINMKMPLVIDPVMSWSTFMHNNTSAFDEYLYTVAANANDEIYACGLTNEAMSSSYLSGIAPGYSGNYTYSLNSDNKKQTAILYKLNQGGTTITAWTYTGQTANVPVAMGIFPNNRVLVLYQNDSVQIFSPDLTTRHYSGALNPSGMSSSIYNYQSLAIADNNTFYIGGVARTRLPASVIPANAPDTSFSNYEGVILKITGAASTTPTASWGTYVGGTSRETFTAIALTPDKSKLAFAVHTEGTGSGYPALVNPIDNTIAGNELLIGNLNLSNLTTFNMFSYLGGPGHEGAMSFISAAALVAADNNYFYVAGNTNSTTLPGTTGAAQTTHGLNSRYADQFLSRIPLNGSAGSGFVTTYNGGNDVDLVGGLVVDARTSDVLLFGTTVSSNFPVYSPNPISPYYQDKHGPFDYGSRDITYTIFSNDLTTRLYSTYIGGSYDDYLGSTGKLEGTGHFQYSTTTGLTYIGTTIHSDQTSIPSQWMSGIPGFDKLVPAATQSKDSHYIFAINPNTSDYGDAPLSYDGSNAAGSAVSFSDIRIGLTVDAEPKANNSDLANGDDLQNYGSDDDEDGVVTAPSMFAFTTSYSVNVSVFNKTGRRVQLCGWIDTDGNGIFDTYEYAFVTVQSRDIQQNVVLNFTGLPPFVPMSGKTYMRLRITNIAMTSASARGLIGKGEVEDYIVPQAVILPITIQTFTATPQNDIVALNWKVANENDARLYEVEFSTDDRTFEPIGSKIPDNSGNYSLLHTTPADGYNYYRIKTTGSDGSISFSVSRKVRFVSDKSITVSPNPVKDLINIHFEDAQQAVTINVLAADGKVVAKKSITAANRTETIDATNLAKGYYFVQITTASGSIIKTIQVTH